jgi:hypothetical protein
MTTEFRLWINGDTTRFFLIPAGQPLPAGAVLLQSLTGETATVDENAAAYFEVSEDEARQHFQAQHYRDAADVLVSRLNEVFEAPVDEQEAVFAEAVLNPPPEQPIADPETLQKELKQFFEQMATLLEGTISGKEEARAAARKHLRRIRKSAAEKGIPLDESFEWLPDIIYQTHTPERRAQLAHLAGVLRETAAGIQEPDASDLNLDAVASYLEAQFDTFTGAKQQRKELKAAREREYRQHADNAIAKSLREFGFNVNRSEDEDESS